MFILFVCVRTFKSGGISHCCEKYLSQERKDSSAHGTNKSTKSAELYLPPTCMWKALKMGWAGNDIEMPQLKLSLKVILTVTNSIQKAAYFNISPRKAMNETN